MSVKTRAGGDVKTIIKLKREEKGLTQVVVAEKARISIRGYQRIEAGERLPNVITAQRIASALNLTVEELFPISSEDAKSGKREEIIN